MNLRVMTTLTKTFPNGTISTWKFGQLHDGRFAAKSNTGKRIILGTTLPQCDRAIHNFMFRYGYTKPSATLIRQLALAV